MKKESVYTNKAPKPVGPYSQAVFFDGFLFTSGIIALKEDGTVEKDVEKAAEIILEALKEILSQKELDFSNVLKVTVYLKDLDDFSLFNGVYERYFKPPFPAREIVEVSRIPKNSPLEVSLIAKA